MHAFSLMEFLVFFILSLQLNSEWKPTEVTDTDHAIYLSMVEISHGKNKTITSIRIKVFLNDIEDAIHNAVGKSVSLADASACETHKAEIQTYFDSHFIFLVNKTKSIIKLESCEIMGDAIWFQFETNSPDLWKDVSLTADFLMELFPTQANVVTIQYGEEKKFLKLTKSKTSEQVKF